MKKELDSSILINHNRNIQSNIVRFYEQTHIEIYNPTEQKRLSVVCKDAIGNIESEKQCPLILDFGAGAGNLSSHLLQLGARVIAADISTQSLEFLKKRFADIGRFDTLELNGTNLSNVNDESFDMVATYSVLHHVPNYLEIIQEFARIIKPGGIIYIDHERNPGYWLEHTNEYDVYVNEYAAAYRQPFSFRLLRKIRLLFSINDWKRFLKRKIYGLTAEGDIHVFKHDHIEWNLIDKILLTQCRLLNREDYLLCRELDPLPPLYTKYKDSCADMRFEIFRKKQIVK
jgi:ubiquinone/menaquinone biosynthesis C-methylase UbiE